MISDLLIKFLRENKFTVTERYLEEDRSRPKLIRAVKGGHKYSIVFSNKEPNILHLFKEKLYKRSINPNVAAVHSDGGKKSSQFQYQRSKIEIDINDPDSFNKILNFV